MPDYFSHVILADKILERLDREHRAKIDDRRLYLLGAQGGDVFFTYNLNFSKSNLGRKLHSLPAVYVFENLAKGNAAYAAGFATHYAVDSTLHPTIYTFEDNSRSPVSHLNFESDLGLYISRRFATPRKILPLDYLLSSTFIVYDSVKRLESSLTVTGVERCLKRFFSYSKLSYNNKRQTYKYDYDYSSLSPLIEESVKLGTEAVKCVLDGNIDVEIFSKDFLQR